MNSFKSSTRTTKQDAYFQIFGFHYILSIIKYIKRRVWDRFVGSNGWPACMLTAEVRRGKKQREWYLEDVVRVFVREAVAA